MRAIAIVAIAVMGAACAGQDQQSVPTAQVTDPGASRDQQPTRAWPTPAGIVDKLNNEINAALADPKTKPVPAANAVGNPQPVPTAQGTDANAVGDPQPEPKGLCARTAAAIRSNFELQCQPKDGNQ